MVVKRIIKINDRQEVFMSDKKSDYDAILYVLDWLYGRDSKKTRKDIRIKKIEIDYIIYDLTRGKR